MEIIGILFIVLFCIIILIIGFFQLVVYDQSIAGIIAIILLVFMGAGVLTLMFRVWLFPPLL